MEKTKERERISHIGKPSAQIARIALQELKSQGLILKFTSNTGPEKDFEVTALDKRVISFIVRSSWKEGLVVNRRYNGIPVIVISHPPQQTRISEKDRRRLIQRTKENILHIASQF